MSLQNVSDTALQEPPVCNGPEYDQAYDLAPPVNLTDSLNFLSGQPHAAFRQMREAAPVMWHPEDVGAGFWALTRHADVKAVELNTKVFSSQMGGIMMNYGQPEMRHPILHRTSLDTMICLDQPYHMPLRREHMAFFTADFISGLKARVEAKSNSLLDAMEAKGGELDLVEHFSAELPLFTLCEILGVPEADRPKLVKWMHYLEVAGHIMARGIEGGVDPNFLAEFLANVEEMFAYGREMLLKRRADPQDDLLSAIANARIDGELLSDEFLDGSWLLIVFAGNDTTRNSLSGTMKLLTEFPDQRARLLADASLMPNMVHEAIRMVSPVIYMRRTATTDAEIGGQSIAKGEKVVMYYGAANRDPAVFENPDQFDVGRPNAKDHIAFGFGPHVCLGQRVANLQLECAYRAILERFPKASWTGEIEIAPNNFVHAISRLSVRLA